MKQGRISLVVAIAVAVLIVGVQVHSITMRSGQDIDSVDLNALLVKAADYADRLEGAVFDFVCQEEIKEWINPALEIQVQRIRRVPGHNFYIPRTPVIRPVKRSLIYDYQCIRKGGKIHERRTLLKENRKEKNGLRFPTEWYIEEAYLTKQGRAFIRSKTTVTYKDFKFFTVEVEVK